MSDGEGFPGWTERWLPLLGGAMVLDVAGMMVSASRGHAIGVGVGAAVYAALLTVAAVLLNRPLWGRTPIERVPNSIAALRGNVRLTALGCLWGALAMQGLYTTRVTSLKWQHGWQYALAMLLLALGATIYAARLGSGNPDTRQKLLRLAAPLAIAQGLGGAVGIVALVFSGKLTAGRADWAANLVFFFGAMLMMVLAAISLRTHISTARG